MTRPSGAGIAAFIGRLALLAWLAWEAVRQLRSDDFEFSLFGGIIFGVHELGHLVFAPFGEVLTAAGGSIAQVALPLAAMALFWKQKDRYAIAVCGCWLAVSLAQLAIYIGDARSEVLDLVSFSSEGAEHDWSFLLGHFNLLRHDTAFARTVRFIAWLTLLVSVALGVREASLARRVPGGQAT